MTTLFEKNILSLVSALFILTLFIMLSACAGTNSGLVTGNVENIDEKINYDGGPVPIPVTTAKRGVIPESIYLVEADSDTGIEEIEGADSQFSNRTNGSSNYSGSESDSQTQTLIGYIKGLVYEEYNPGVLGVIKNGKYTQFIEVTPDEEFKVAVYEEDLEEPFALVVGENQDMMDEIVSAPVIVTVVYDAYFNAYRILIHLTNISLESTDSAGGDIESAQIAISSSGIIAFSAINASDERFTGLVDIAGGPNSLQTKTDNLLAKLKFDSEGILFGIDIISQVITTVDEDGESTTIGETANLPSKNDFSIHPDDRYVLTKVKAINAVGNDTLTIGIIDRDEPNTVIVIPPPASETDGATEVTFTWSDGSHIVVIYEYPLGYVTVELHVSPLLEGLSTTVGPPTLKFTTTDYKANPITDFRFSNYIYYDCYDNVEEKMNLCSYDRDTGLIETEIAIENHSITNATMSPDFGFIIFEIIMEAEENILAKFDTVTREIEFLNRCSFAAIYSENTSLIICLSKDYTGRQQISLVNTEKPSIIPTTLKLNKTTLTMPVNSHFTFMASGGLPPYNYSIVSGEGDMNSSTGLYSSPSVFGGTTIVRVTDDADNYVDATITINPPIAAPSLLPNVQVNNSYTYTPTGGVEPYTFEIVSGGGTINPETGEYTAADTEGTVTIKATDSFGNEVEYTITVIGLPSLECGWCGSI